MSTYIHLFETVSAYTEARNSEYTEPWVSYTVENEKVDYNLSEEEKKLLQPLTFEITSDGTINWGHDFGEWSPLEFSRTLEYRKNDGEWTEITSTEMIYNDSTDRYSGGTVINVVSGDVVEFRGNNADFCYFDENIYGIRIFCSFEPSTCGFKLSGNIMSLINSTEYATLTTLESAYTFYLLFGGSSGLTDASNLLLPATTLTDYCYKSMFGGCRNLVNAPELPATTLAQGCYSYMFDGCTSITTAPTLPATTLAQGCYDGMFSSCESLTGVPELPATTLAAGCYDSMFYGCTSLTTAPSLPATTLADYCYQSMFSNCTSLTTAPELPATTLAESCYSYMFQGCTSLTTAPELPATSLVSSCYESMFAGCTSLTTAPELPATTLAESCYSYMFYGCSSLNYIKCLTTTISASYSHYYWVSGVQTTSGTFVKNSSITESTWGRGVSGIPNNWTVEDDLINVQ